MGFRVGFKVAPGLYYSTRLGGRRRRARKGDAQAKAVAAAVLIGIGLAFAYPPLGIILIVAAFAGLAVYGKNAREKKRVEAARREEARARLAAKPRDYSDWREWSTDPRVRAELARERGEL